MRRIAARGGEAARAGEVCAAAVDGDVVGAPNDLAVPRGAGLAARAAADGGPSGGVVVGSGVEVAVGQGAGLVVAVVATADVGHAVSRGARLRSCWSAMPRSLC